MYLPTPLGDCWGLDTSAKLTPALLEQLCAVDLFDVLASVGRKGPPRGTRPAFFGRYLPLPGVSPAGDIDDVERGYIADTGRSLVLFQHVRYDHWIASAQQGADDAAHAVAMARDAGYAPVSGYLAPSVIKDCEAVGNPGPASVAATRGFLEVCAAAAYGRAAYQGFDPGLTPDDFGALGCPIASSTPYNKPPTGRGFAYVQIVEVTICGVRCDVAHSMLDACGECLVGMAEIRVDVEPLDDPDGPHTT